MFDLAWSEIALIAVVAVVVIGPKDLPDAVRGVAKGIQKLRRMAGQFQGQLDEVVREAKLEDVRQSINEIRNFDFKGEIEKHVDADGSLRKTISEDPIKDADPFGVKSPVTPDPVVAGPVTPEHPSATETPAVTEATVAEAAPPEAPAFIPPEEVAKAKPVALPPIPEVDVPYVPPAPSFLPPAEVEAERKKVEVVERLSTAGEKAHVSAGHAVPQHAGAGPEAAADTTIATGEKPDAKPATQS